MSEKELFPKDWKKEEKESSTASIICDEKVLTSANGGKDVKEPSPSPANDEKVLVSVNEEKEVKEPSHSPANDEKMPTSANEENDVKEPFPAPVVMDLAHYCGICGHHFENQTDKYCPLCGKRREEMT